MNREKEEEIFRRVNSGHVKVIERYCNNNMELLKAIIDMHRSTVRLKMNLMIGLSKKRKPGELIQLNIGKKITDISILKNHIQDT